MHQGGFGEILMTANVIRLGQDVKQLEMLNGVLSRGSAFVLIMHLNV